MFSLRFSSIFLVVISSDLVTSVTCLTSLTLESTTSVTVVSLVSSISLIILSTPSCSVLKPFGVQISNSFSGYQLPSSAKNSLEVSWSLE